MSAKEAPTIALLSRAHSPTSATRIYAEKIQHRPLLLKPSDSTTTTPSACARHQRRLARVHRLAQRRQKQRPRPLSAREKRASRIYAVPHAGQRYAVFEALHGMWAAYIRDVLFDGHGPRAGGPVTAATAAKLVAADYHGAEVEVVRSRCVSRVGVRGIVIKDTMHTFEIITKHDVVKTVPKEHTVFRFEVSLPASTEAGVEGRAGLGRGEGAGMAAANDASKVEDGIRPLVFEIYGSQFQTRSSDRAVRKPKPHYYPDL